MCFASKALPYEPCVPSGTVTVSTLVWQVARITLNKLDHVGADTVMNNKMQQKRKQTLQQTIDQVYARHRPGRFATRRQRINTMRQVVHSLNHICSLPTHWSELTVVQII